MKYFIYQNIIPNRRSKSKLIIEILFEIIMEMYLEYSLKFNLSDDITLSNNYYELRDYILIYKYKDYKNLFSTCILFCIKLILSIKELKEFYSLNKPNIISSTKFHSSNSETDSVIKNKDNENAINLNGPNVKCS